MTLRNTVIRGQIHLLLSELAGIARTGHRGRSREEVVSHYNGEQSRLSGDLAIYRINGSYLYLSHQQMIEVCRHKLKDLICALPEVRTVCEIGCGKGANLYLLQRLLPGKTYCGFDISQRAVAQARLDRLDVNYANATSIPAAYKSYDLVFTFAALEQMQLDLDAVLGEIRRIARRHVIFYEPFADANTWLERRYLWSRNYFRMPSHRLRSYGFMPVTTVLNVPKKPNFGYCFVVCEVA